MPTPRKRSKGSKAPAGKIASKKEEAKRAAGKSASSRAKRGKSAYEPTDNEIRLRAYFIAEHRSQMELEGDAAKDWLEARRQLLAEATPSESK